MLVREAGCPELIRKLPGQRTCDEAMQKSLRSTRCRCHLETKRPSAIPAIAGSGVTSKKSCDASSSSKTRRKSSAIDAQGAVWTGSNKAGGSGGPHVRLDVAARNCL